MSNKNSPRKKAAERIVLVTGANGQVGHEMGRHHDCAGHPVRCLTREQLDITDANRVKTLLAATEPALVINTAAYTAVDNAEREAETAFAANRSGPQHLATACHALGIPLIHISTDYVFDGQKKGPYREDDPVSPLGVYGHSKLKGERAIRKVLERHVILRTSWVFGAHGHNFVKTMLRLGREREQLNIIDDQSGGPTPAAAIAEALLQIAEAILEGEKTFWGTYHFSGVPATSWFLFAEEIFKQASAMGLQPPKLLPIPTSAYPTPAKRPANSVFDCSKIKDFFGINQPSWKRGLAFVLKELLSSKQP